MELIEQYLTVCGLLHSYAEIGQDPIYSQVMYVFICLPLLVILSLRFTSTSHSCGLSWKRVVIRRNAVGTQLPCTVWLNVGGCRSIEGYARLAQAAPVFVYVCVIEM